MPLGPVEIVVIGFPENRFDGSIVPEVQALVDDNTVTIIDGLFARKDADGSITLVELREADPNSDVARLLTSLDRIEGLVSDEDVETLTESLEPDSSAVILVFEHTWMKPLRDAVQGAGGQLLDSVRVPGAVVEELLATIPDED